MALSLSASTIKSWFQYRCERKTRYEMMESNELVTAGVDKAPTDVGAWASLGNEFETAIVQKLIATGQALPLAPGEDKLSQARTEAFLRGSLPHNYAPQATLDAHRTASAALTLPDGISLRRSFPDLIRVDRSVEPPVFSIIDIKGTQSARAFHKAQVAFYAELLEKLLVDLRVPGVISSQGEIWCIKEGTLADEGIHRSEVFDLQPYRRLVKDFFSRELLTISQKEVSHYRDDTFFHIYYKCEQCQYLPHCIKSINKADAADRDISAVPGLTHEGKKTLLRRGISNLGALTEAHLNAQSPNLNWSLQRRAEVLIARAKAQTQGRLQRIPDLATYLMPPRVDAALYIVADYDPVEDNLVTLGYRFKSATKSHSIVRVLKEGDKSAEANAISDVMGSLIEDLTAIDAHNQQHVGDLNAELHAHIFLFEPTEAQYLQNAIGRHLDDPRIRTGLLHAVRLFPPEDLVPEPELRGIHHLPATALRSVFEQLFALPVRVSYDLRQVSEAIAVCDANFCNVYRPHGPFRREFSSLLAMDVIRALRNSEDRGNLEAIKADVEARLETTASLVEWLLEENLNSAKRFLRLNKRPFRFQAMLDPLNAKDLDILQAYELLEARSSMLATLVRLTQAFPQRRASGQCMAELKLLKSGNTNGKLWLLFKIPLESQDSDISSDDFALILTNDDPDIRLNPYRWGECRVSIAPRQDKHQFDSILVTIHKPQDKPLFQQWLREIEGPGWFLDRVYEDFTSYRAQEFLAYLDAK